LTAVLLLASQQETIVQGTLLLAVYSPGLGLPFLITGAALGKICGAIRHINRYVGVISKVSGILLIIVGWLLVTDQLRSLLGNLILEYGQGLVAVESHFRLGAAEVSFPLAFVAGALSFFSPCVLPLVPVYIGYLSGASLTGTMRTTEAAQPAA
jgi:cytochrome c-type biogenesis protein